MILTIIGLNNLLDHSKDGSAMAHSDNIEWVANMVKSKDQMAIAGFREVGLSINEWDTLI